MNKIILASLISLSPFSHASVVVNLVGPITQDTAVTFNFANNITNVTDVTININSLGGEVDAALAIIKQINTWRQNKIPVICYATHNVRSAAWLIYNACSVRKAYRYSMFEWHSLLISISSPVPIVRLQQQLIQLVKLQRVLNRYLQKQLNFPQSWFSATEQKDLIFTGEQLFMLSPNYLTLVDL